jgi:predicted Zn-dependent peptidase
LGQFLHRNWLQVSKVLTRTNRDIERIGATAAANAGRDSFDLIGDVHVDSVEQLLAIFGDSLLHPKTSSFHFRAVIDAAVEDSKLLESDASSVLTECAHAAGFGGRGLGRRSNPGSSIIASLSPQDFSRHVAAASSPSAITVAASGVDHATFVAAAAGIFGSLKGSSSAPSPSGWIGGDSRASMSGKLITDLQFQCLQL